MKKFLVVVSSLIMLLAFVLPSLADTMGNTWLGAGYIGNDGEKSNQGGTALAMGARLGHWGYEFGEVNFPTYPNVNNSPYTHNGNYIVKDSTCKISAFGLDILYFYDISDKVTLFAGPGLYNVKKYNVVQAKDTETDTHGNYIYYGKYYNQGETNEINIDVDLGLQYKLSDKFSLGAGYDLIRSFYFKFVGNF